MKYYTDVEFKRLSKTAQKTATLVKVLAGTPEPMPERSLKFTISTADIDRSEDNIIQSGIDLNPYKMNPVVLWMHDDKNYPVGKATSIGIEDNVLKAVVEFLPRDMPDGAGERAEAVYQMLLKGFLSATSISFKPIDFDFAEGREDGITYKSVQLLEFSIVTVPCNAMALIDDVPEQPEEIEENAKDMDDESSVDDAIKDDVTTDKRNNINTSQRIKRKRARALKLLSH